MSLSGFSEATLNEPGENPNSIASLVYAGDNNNGYRPPTTREIPQLRLASLEAPPPDEEFRVYQQQLGDFTEVSIPESVPDLSSVPSVFSLSTFSLDNPRVFAQVVGTEDNIDYTILLEKMSWYIDIVELHLLDYISQASSSFFKVTSQFNEIEASAQQATTALLNLSTAVDEIRKFSDHEEQSIEILHRLEGLQDLSSHIDQLSRFYAAFKECKVLSNTNVPALSEKIGPALELLSTPHDLKGVTALIEPIAAMESFKTRVYTYYQEEIVSRLIQDLNQHIAAVPIKDTLDRIGRILHIPGHKQSQSHNNSWSQVSPDLRQTLSDLIKGAIGNQVLDLALKRYVDATTKEVKALIRQYLPKLKDPDSNEGANALSVSLKELTVAEFEKIIAEIYAHLSEALRRISTQFKLLLDLCSSMGHSLLIGSMLEDLVTATDERIVKILKARKDIMLTSSVDEYIHIYSLCGIFMSECESICGIYAPELSTFLASQTEVFAAKFTTRHQEEIITSLNMDTWKKEELPSSFQITVDLIVESSDQDPLTWLKQWRYAIDNIESEIKPPKNIHQNVFVKDSSYFITRSSVKLVDTLTELLKLVCLLPQTTIELSQQYIKMFELFDSKVRSLILGTGAMTSGSGLKRITFRHLSLAFESLGFINSILLNSRECIQRHMQDYSAFSIAANGLQSSLKQHQDDIEGKFITILSDKSQSYSRSISITNWSACPPTANQYMQNLVKDITTVSRILEDILSKDTAKRIISQIFDIFKGALLKAYTGLHIKNTSALENVIKDIRYFQEHMNDINGSGNLGEILYESMSAFAIPEDIDQPEQLPSPIQAQGSADMTVGDISEADISMTPSRYRDKNLPETPNEKIEKLTLDPASDLNDVQRVSDTSADVQADPSKDIENDNREQDSIVEKSQIEPEISTTDDFTARSDNVVVEPGSSSPSPVPQKNASSEGELVDGKKNLEQNIQSDTLKDENSETVDKNNSDMHSSDKAEDNFSSEVAAREVAVTSTAENDLVEPTEAKTDDDKPAPPKAASSQTKKKKKGKKGKKK